MVTPSLAPELAIVGGGAGLGATNCFSTAECLPLNVIPIGGR
jgi:hypothetical protein